MKSRKSERGSALLLIMIITIILVGISFAYMTISYLSVQRAEQEIRTVQALYVAESAAAAKLTDWNSGAAAPRPSSINTVQFLGGGAYVIPSGSLVDFANATPSDANYVSFQVVTWYPVSPVGDAAYINSVNAFYAGNPGAAYPPAPRNKDMIMKKVDYLLSRAGGGVYWNAIFAGNSQNDLYNGQAYTLGLSGASSASMTLKDTVWGNIYSGGGVAATGPAQLEGANGQPGSTVTYNGGSSSNTSTVTDPAFVQGSEPPPTITKNSSGQTDWENAAHNFESGNRQDPATGISYIDVAHDLSTMGSTGRWADNSTAVQITDQNQPSHIFRQNPSSDFSSTDRTTAYEYTYTNPIANGATTNITKNDYYLEDPTQAVTHPSLTGVPVNGDTSASAVSIAPNGNNAVYFIDGNLRVSGEPIRSYQLTPMSGTGNIQMTMVVKGNISLTDNVLYPNWQSQSDALAMIAVQDPAFPNKTATDFSSGAAALAGPSGLTVNQFRDQYNTLTQKGIDNGSNLQLLPTTDASTWTPAQRDLAAQEYNKTYGSGNIFFGDPGSGTVEHFEGFLYAENNFYGESLNANSSSGGTKDLEIWGNMTAGNQIRINRQVRNTNLQGAPNYIPLSVKFDPSIMNGSAMPPALPPTPSFGNGNWFVASSRVAP